jgi:hypothetical protein
MHECSICGQRFSLGQALGGHMRRHKAIINEENVSETKKGRGRPKSNTDLASRAMNYVQIASQFSESNQGISLYNLC